MRQFLNKCEHNVIIAYRMTLVVDVLEGVTAVPVHVAITIRGASVREQEGNLKTKNEYDKTQQKQIQSISSRKPRFVHTIVSS